MTPNAMSQFEKLRLNTQYQLYGAPVKIGNVTGVGCFNAPRLLSNLKEGGQIIDMDVALKLRKADWPAYKARKHWEGTVVHLQLGGEFVKFKVSTAIDSHLGSEWKLELESYF